MKTRIDREKLKRRATVSRAASLGGILILLGSTAISLWRPEWSTLTAAMLFAGFAAATAGIYYANRWVKKPRPEDTLDHALKGLSGKYCLYHYELSSDPVLLTPRTWWCWRHGTSRASSPTRAGSGIRRCLSAGRCASL
jgi:hypothetical protein